jgi:CRP/FNR family transcriptional regulator, nitrogen fixation regulation protein
MGIDTDVTAHADVGRKVQAFGRGQHLFEENERAVFFDKVVSGVIRTYKVQEDGRRHIDSFHVAGDFFCIETGPQYRFTADAVRDTKVIAIRRCRLETLSALEPALARELPSSVMRSLERAQHHS